MSANFVSLLINKTGDWIPNRRLRKNYKNFLKVRLSVGVKEQLTLYKALSKYYAGLDFAAPYCVNADAANLPVWQLWLQGRDAAPALVRKCFDSVAEYAVGREIRVLSLNDFDRYLELPGYVWDKYRAGVIPHAHFADLLRVSLLAQYGGTWIDATVLLTGPIPAEITASSFFMFDADPTRLYGKIYLAQNWFINACPQHAIMQGIRQALLNYWAKENFVVDYFFFHLMFAGLVRTYPELKRLWDEGLHITTAWPERLQKFFIDPFDAARLAEIKSHTTIHKLTYFRKYLKEPRKSTFLAAFLNNDAAF